MESQVVAWIGCDVAKETFDAAWCPAMAGGASSRVSRLPVRTFPRTRKGVRDLLAWMDHQQPGQGTAAPVRVVMEATGRYSLELAQWMREQRVELAPAIINPQITRSYMTSLGFRDKTDKVESRGLACFGSERRPAPYEPVAPEYAALQELSRCRDDLVALRVAEENRLQEAHTVAAVRQTHEQVIAVLNRKIERLENEMKKVAHKMPKLREDMELLQSIYGVGFIVAATVLAELGDLASYESGRQLTAFAGLSPRQWESGASVRKQPRLCKKGPSRVRTILYLAALTARRGESELGDYYHRLIANGKKPKAALLAIGRKLLVLMRAILISRIPYQTYYKAEEQTSATCGYLDPQKA